jgi:flagellar hook-associated protein 3 FlgL
MSTTTGLAAAIKVNPTVDPSQGGNPNLLRDGGISDPGNPAYTYTPSGSASYTGRIQQLIGQISATQAFDPSAGLGSSSSLTEYANASVSWLQGENQQASNSSSYQNALVTQATAALSNATGVNLDAEMTNMLNLENSYAFVGEAVDHCHQYVLRPPERRMTTISANFVSSQALANSLVLPVMQAQSSLTKAMTEESTGQYADLGLQLGEQSGYELSLKEQVDQLQALTAGNSLVSTNLSTAQNALSAISSSAQTTLNGLATWTPSANSGASLQNMGQSALQSLIASANTTSGDQYVFGGINSAVAPMTDYYSIPSSVAKTAVDVAFQTAFGVLPSDPAAAGISALAMQSFLSGPFAALFQGTSWTADWSSASITNTSAEITPGQTVMTSTNANQPGFQELAQAYAMLSEFGGSELSGAAQQAVAMAASSLVSQGIDSMTNVQADLGSTQSAVTNANTAMSSQLTILQQQVGNVDDVNANTTAAQINSLTNQIQMAYEPTARLQQLNLAQYLPVT